MQANNLTLHDWPVAVEELLGSEVAKEIWETGQPPRPPIDNACRALFEAMLAVAESRGADGLQALLEREGTVDAGLCQVLEARQDLTGLGLLRGFSTESSANATHWPRLYITGAFLLVERLSVPAVPPEADSAPERDWETALGERCDAATAQQLLGRAAPRIIGQDVGVGGCLLWSGIADRGFALSVGKSGSNIRCPQSPVGNVGGAGRCLRRGGGLAFGLDRLGSRSKPEIVMLEPARISWPAAFLFE